MLKKTSPAKLILEDGSIFEGFSFSNAKSVSGEVVFNTGMVGYPESFTDPSYRGQILVLTYPLIGNYGVPKKIKEKENGLLKNFESNRIQITGLVVSEISHGFHHWDSEIGLLEWLNKENIPTVFGVDTRVLTKKLREKGVMLGKIELKENIEFVDPNKRNLVEEVSIKKPIVYGSKGKKILLIDCGVKNNIIRCLLKRKTRVLRVPWNFNPFHLKEKIDFDAVVISNGPGDPKMANKTIETVKEILKREIPTFGICLGNQILALASGADTFKLKYGHRSQNQPCNLVGTKKCFITSQNHGYAVNEKSLKKGWFPWFRNANDGSNEGIIHKSKPFMAVQFHPEASPGPTDTEYLFDEFLKLV